MNTNENTKKEKDVKVSLKEVKKFLEVILNSGIEISMIDEEAATWIKNNFEEF